MVVSVCIVLLVIFRQRLNHQGKLAKNLAANVYTVYLIHPLLLVGFAYAFRTVALYPLLKFVISVLIVLSLCFLLSNLILRLLKDQVFFIHPSAQSKLHLYYPNSNQLLQDQALLASGANQP